MHNNSNVTQEKKGGVNVSLLTCPRLLSSQSEAVALRMGVTDVRCLSGTVDRQHTAQLAVGRPAAVLHVPGGPHTSHHGVI